MASVWGYSWGHSWGNAWGSIVVGLCAYDNENPYDNTYTYDASSCPIVVPEPEIPVVKKQTSASTSSPDKPKKTVTKPKTTKLHIAELYKQLELKNVTRLIQDDEELLTLLGFMISNRVLI